MKMADGAAKVALTRGTIQLAGDWVTLRLFGAGRELADASHRTDRSNSGRRRCVRGDGTQQVCLAAGGTRFTERQSLVPSLGGRRHRRPAWAAASAASARTAGVRPPCADYPRL